MLSNDIHFWFQNINPVLKALITAPIYKISFQIVEQQKFLTNLLRHPIRNK